MTTLYVDRRNLSCKIENGALVFSEDGQRCGTIPTAPLERVVFHCNVQIDTHSLGRLGKEGIGVIILSGRGHRPTLFLPSQYHDAERRMAQYSLSQNPEYRLRRTTDTIREKIDAQRECLEALAAISPRNDSHEVGEALSKASENLVFAGSIESILGIEGQAAATYFKALSAFVPNELHFNGRNRRPPKDPFNAVLSLTYTLLTCDAALAANTAGLDSYVGFLHALEYGRHSLACDLIEPVRPQADQFALQLFIEGILTKDNFATSNQGCLLDKAGRSAFYPAYEKAAPAWRSVLRKSALGLAERLVADFRNSQFRMPAYGQGK